MKAFWIPCVGGRFHITGKCPKCSDGVYFVSASIQNAGVLDSTCMSCGNKQGLYVLPDKGEVWALAEPVEVTKITEKT